MKKNQISAIGQFLAYYENDLRYILNFQKFKAGKIQAEDYVKKEEGSFYKFVIEFKIVRNFPKGTAIDILNKTKDWINSKQADDVDLFAQNLKIEGYTRGDSRSLASKILFLNNPWEIIPMDRLTRATLGVKNNNYDDYLYKLKAFESKNQKHIQSMVDYIKPLIDIIHKNYQDLNDLNIIAKNRMIDKLLWSGEIQF